METLFLMSGDVARLLGMSQSRVIQLERAGKLRAVKTARGWRLFDPKDVDDLLARRVGAKGEGGEIKRGAST